MDLNVLNGATGLAPTIQVASRFASPVGSSLIPAWTLASPPPYKQPVSLLPRREVHSFPPRPRPCPRHTSGQSVCFPGGKFTHPRPDLGLTPAIQAASWFASPAGSSLIPALPYPTRGLLPLVFINYCKV